MIQEFRSYNLKIFYGKPSLAVCYSVSFNPFPSASLVGRVSTLQGPWIGDRIEVCVFWQSDCHRLRLLRS